MKKVWALLAGAAAFAGAAWYLNKKKAEATGMVYSEEFDENSPPAVDVTEETAPINDEIVVEIEAQEADAQ